MIKYVFVLVLLIILAVEDIKKQTVDIRVLGVATVILLGLIFILGEPGAFTIRAIGVLPGLLFLVISLLSNGGVGLGDGLVLISLGISEGILGVLEILAYAMAFSFFVALFYLLKRIKKSIPFLPFLAVGYLIFMINNLGVIHS